MVALPSGWPSFFVSHLRRVPYVPVRSRVCFPRLLTVPDRERLSRFGGPPLDFSPARRPHKNARRFCGFSASPLRIHRRHNAVGLGCETEKRPLRHKGLRPLWIFWISRPKKLALKCPFGRHAKVMRHGPPIFLRRHDAGTLGKNRAKDPLRRKGSKAVRKIRRNFPNFPPPFHGSGKAPSQAAASLLALCFPSGTKNRQKHGKSIRGGDATPRYAPGVGRHSRHHSNKADPPPAGLPCSPLATVWRGLLLRSGNVPLARPLRLPSPPPS